MERSSLEEVITVSKGNAIGTDPTSGLKRSGRFEKMGVCSWLSAIDISVKILRKYQMRGGVDLAGCNECIRRCQVVK